MKLIPISVLFAGLGAAPAALSQVPIAPAELPGKAENDPPAPEVQPAAVELADCLAGVYSTASADAAAPRAAELCALLTGQGGEETFWARMHMAYADCYGSEPLRLALRSVLPPADTPSNPDFRDALVILHDIWLSFEDIRVCLDAVHDKGTADAAADRLTLLSGHIDDCLRRGGSVAPPKGNRIDLVIYYFSGEYRRTAAVYKAWGELQNRSGNYYGSEDLATAMEQLCAAMENLDLPADPYAIGRMLPVCERMEEQMCRWLEIAVTVHDTATAEAAAPGLLAVAESMRGIVKGLGQGYEKDLGHVSPRFLFLSMACDRLVKRFSDNAFFSSPALSDALGGF